MPLHKITSGVGNVGCGERREPHRHTDDVMSTMRLTAFTTTPYGIIFWMCVSLLCLVQFGCATKPDKAPAAVADSQSPARAGIHKEVQQAKADPNRDAIQALEKTVQAKPSAPAYNQLGIFYRESGRFTEARAAYESALKINPDYALAQRNLGILFDIYLQQPQQALMHYRAYARLSGEQNAEAALWVAELQQRLGVNAESTGATP